jgi:oxygen-dependent protoporphyrinogen oxidase
MTERRVVVIGAGIAGLTAAFRLCATVAVTVLDESTRPGGKVATEPFAGIDLDTGPDSFLARVPAAAELCRTLGLGGDLVAPATGAAYLWTRRRLRRLPTGLVLGAPTDLVSLARSRVLSPMGTLRAGLDLVLPATPTRPADTSVGHVIRSRLGAEAHLRLVDPLLGGINAGRTEHLSMAVVAPQLAVAAARHRSLIRSLRSAPPPAPGPVFLTVQGGMSRLVAALAGRVGASPGSEIRLGEGAAALARDAGGWRVATTAGATVVADAVVVAVPAPVAARLLGTVSPTAASTLESIRYSSVVLTTLAYQADDVAHRLDGSGLLVPRVEGRLMTACSWTGSKWPHLATPGQVILRVSAGRAGDNRALDLNDGELVARLHGELAEAIGARRPPRQARVHRWVDAFPQFEPGHLDRVATIDEALAAEAAGIRVAGAAYRGVGLATCIVGAEAAARSTLADLGYRDHSRR